jgi:hypothetical protein
VFLVLSESPQQHRLNGVYFTIFRAKVWKKFCLEWILLLDIQTNCKNWVWKENSVELSMCLHLGPTAQATLVWFYFTMEVPKRYFYWKCHMFQKSWWWANQFGWNDHVHWVEHNSQNFWLVGRYFWKKLQLLKKNIIAGMLKILLYICMHNVSQGH